MAGAARDAAGERPQRVEIAYGISRRPQDRRDHNALLHADEQASQGRQRGHRIESARHRGCDQATDRRGRHQVPGQPRPDLFPEKVAPQGDFRAERAVITGRQPIEEGTAQAERAKLFGLLSPGEQLGEVPGGALVLGQILLEVEMCSLLQQGHPYRRDRRDDKKGEQPPSP